MSNKQCWCLDSCGSLENCWIVGFLGVKLFQSRNCAGNRMVKIPNRKLNAVINIMFFYFMVGLVLFVSWSFWKLLKTRVFYDLVGYCYNQPTNSNPNHSRHQKMIDKFYQAVNNFEKFYQSIYSWLNLFLDSISYYQNRHNGSNTGTKAHSQDKNPWHWILFCFFQLMYF